MSFQMNHPSKRERSRAIQGVYFEEIDVLRSMTPNDEFEHRSCILHNKVVKLQTDNL